MIVTGQSEQTNAAIGTLSQLANDSVAMLPLLAIAAVVFVIFWLIAFAVRWLVRRYVERRSGYQGAALAFARLAYLGILLLGLLVAMTVAFPTITPGRLFSTLGIGGVAIGFAFKDILQNLLAGILILLRHPFRIGDEIVSGEFQGTVENIETRATFIRTYDGQRIIVPNSKIYTEPVTVITAYDMLRSEYDVGIGYGDDIGKAMKVALSVLGGVDGVLAEPKPDVQVSELGGSSVNLRVRWWTDPTRSDVMRVRSEVLRNVAEKMAENAIDLPFPTQVVLFHDQTEDVDGDRTKQREGWPAGDSPPKPRARMLRDE